MCMSGSSECHGVVNLLGLPWIDFVVCTIYRDENTWENEMLPELTSFFFSFIATVCETPQPFRAS